MVRSFTLWNLKRKTECWISVSPRKQYVLFSSRSPPSIQRIPWPVRTDSEDEDETQKKVWAGYDTWVLNEDEFSWLVEPDGK